MQHGGDYVGQVPPPGYLPSLSSPSISSTALPTFLTAAVPSSNSRVDYPNIALDASDEPYPPVVDISIEHPSNEQPPTSGQTPLASASELSEDSDTQMKGRKPAIAAVGTFFSLATFSQIYQHALFPRITPPSERAEDKTWVDSSHSWLDRRVCNWFGLCGLAHLDKSHWTTQNKLEQQEASGIDGKEKDRIDLNEFWNSAQTLPKDWSETELKDREIPQYVIDHAPLIHLYSGEEFWPGDMAEHLFHTTPHLNYTALQATDDHPNLINLNQLNKWGRFVYLKSDDNVEDRPEWLGGESNIPNVPDDPDSDDSTRNREELEHVDDETWQPELIRRRLKRRGRKVVGGRSEAPAVLVVVPKDNGTVDAFWFFFYSYNLGNSVFNVRFGNHVGDWEHTTVRFQDGVPKAIFFSEHSFGEAYTWDAVEKSGKRPIGFSATGTHAMYATPGLHPYVLPGGILHDVTDRGPLWDPTQNMYSYTYNYRRDILRSSNLNPQAPIGWFYFMGHWGDKFYPLDDPRQYRFLGQYHYVNGPLGPRFKNLGRKDICQGGDECILKKWIGDKHVRPYVKRYPNVDQGEEMSAEDVRRFIGPEEDFA